MNGKLYRWWTVSAGSYAACPGWWLKLGPITIAFFGWPDGLRIFEIHCLNHIMWTRYFDPPKQAEAE